MNLMLNLGPDAQQHPSPGQMGMLRPSRSTASLQLQRLISSRGLLWPVLLGKKLTPPPPAKTKKAQAVFYFPLILFFSSKCNV